MQREFSINASRSFPENDCIIMNTAFIQGDDSTHPETVMPIKQEGNSRDNSTEMQLENPYESPDSMSPGTYAAMHSPVNWSHGSKRTTGKESLYRKLSLVFFSLWTISLIACIIGLILLSQQKSENEVKLGMNTKVISDLQGELRDMEDFCSSLLMCAANVTRHANKMSEISMRTGIIMKPVWSWIRQAAVDVNLDPSTAHPKLIISGDRKSVRLGENRQAFPENPKRFDFVVSVLGKEGFSSGRHYWEVEVKHKIDWTLGVVKGTVSRKGSLLFRPDTGFWTIILKDGMYKANSESPVLLSLRERPQKVGVYVDYGMGQVSFYSVDSRTHIYSFSGCNFTEELHPFLRPGLNDDGKNTSPLIITPINVHQK
ncbi:E3 ubiquitin-protein ligase TRIM21-like isoform X2 [Brienomyrus brachyistius]|uniref:E3 ubiquitin-protein ligase TRIM21-like isoform X2 n=1 Tax=Brienomyrus brachyistius TaxID=42636 RepID=UPI0020B36032|nr:E3 ubiquitin-protein ligase TRIM21-like isoform X2 [Brienomyrus brachyistius]